MHVKQVRELMTSLPQKAGCPLQFQSCSTTFLPTSGCKEAQCHLCYSIEEWLVWRVIQWCRAEVGQRTKA